MSIECTSNHCKKCQLFLASCERTNELCHLWYQWNKDAINECRRSEYHRRTTGIHIANEFPHNRKYQSLVDIMQRTFPIIISFSKYFSNLNFSPLIDPLDMYVFFQELFPIP